jgi:glycosyltransferase involved in cell wall biosynthesis
MKKTILYLRTDLYYEKVIAGGSVGHTLGVIKGFLDLGYQIICVTTCLVPLIKKLSVSDINVVKKPPLLKFIRWQLGSFLQTFTVAWAARSFLKNYNITAFYQRYSTLNWAGVLLRWWYKKKFILEYNGSEVWVSKNWNEPGNKFLLLKPIEWVERLNLSKADFIVVVSELLKKELIGRGINAKKILVNPNGVDPGRFDSTLFVPQSGSPCHKQL